MFLTDKEIRKLIEEKDLVSGYIDLERQIQPHGFDFTVEKVFEISSRGEIDFSNERRRIPGAREVDSEQGKFELEEGGYKIRTNERVSIPSGIAGFAQSRSSLLRSGCSVSHGFWDSGFEGKSEFLLKVGSNGLLLYEDARISQIVFLWISGAPEQLYKGIFSD